MAETPSTMLPLGKKAPDFILPDTISGQMMELENIKSSVATVIMFICNHCPYVKYIEKKLLEVVKFYQQKGVVFIAINSNDVLKYPDDNPANMQKEALKLNYTFPYLFDETQEVARAYQAACTPDFYLFDQNLACVYRGRFDNATPRNHSPVTGIDLTNALDNLLTNNPIDANQYPSLGCNIKWK